ITRQTDYRPEGVEVAAGLEQAIELARGDSELFITGGGEIYRIALPLVQRIYLTWVDADVPGDTLFPEWKEAEWQLVLDEQHPADEKNDYPHHFRVYDRCAP
ncbi:MAG: dihydrofolate reductase, partial [Planctomycetota bacterium]